MTGSEHIKVWEGIFPTFDDASRHAVGDGFQQ